MFFYKSFRRLVGTYVCVQIGIVKVLIQTVLFVHFVVFFSD